MAATCHCRGNLVGDGLQIAPIMPCVQLMWSWRANRSVENFDHRPTVVAMGPSYDCRCFPLTDHLIVYIMGTWTVVVIKFN